MADYYRKTVNKVVNDVKLKMQLGALTLKLSENNNKIDDLIGVDKNIKKDVSSNSGLISANESAISTNLEKINDIKSSLPTSEIFKKTYSIKNQSFRFTRNIVYFKLLEIEIENNFKIDGILEFDNYIYYKYDNLQRDHHRLQHEYRILDDKNNLLYKKILNKTNTSDLDFDKNIMLVKDNFYVTFKNNYNKIKIILDLFRVYRHGTGNFNLELINDSFVNITYLDKNDISLKIDSNKDDIASNLSKINTNEGNISTNLGKINTNEGNISTNLGKINTNEGNISTNLGKINTNEGNISTNLGKINTNEGNISTNLGKINTNEGNISTNLIKINSNEDDILYNLNEIDYLKNNMSKSYLKNIYNISFYESKTQIDFRSDSFYEKVFDVNSKQNDFIEIYFKIDLQYEDISERSYVKTIYQLFDENDNSLYIKSVTNSNYNYFQNRIIIDENIFYNFTNSIKKLKFVIKFQMLLSRVIKIWYIKNDNYRLILKHYSS